MNSLVNAVKKAMPPKGNLRRYRVGILYNGNPKLVDAVLALGHRTVVFSDQFRPLYKMLKHYRRRGGQVFDTTLMAEASLDALPIAEKSLDVLILSNGLMCRGTAPAARLSALKRLIKPGGYLLTFSCSHHIQSNTFIDMVASAARNINRTYQITRHYHQAPDHPSLLTMPETSYFKGLMLHNL